MDAQIGYCTTSDNVRLAHAVSGTGPTLVRVGAWYTHLQHDWDLSGWSDLYRAFGKRFQFVRYDVRGTGLSDRFPKEISVETFVRDLETVVDALRLERFALLGISQGGAVGILYALRHPERVSHIVLLNAFARGAGFREGVAQGQEVVNAMRALIRRGWGSDDPSFRAIFTTQMMPTATPDQAQRWNECERVSVSPEVAERIFGAIHSEIKIVDRLSDLRVPTLVLHVRDDRRVPFEEGRMLAAHIPSARFVPIAGANHVLLPQDAGFGTAVEEICSFLGVRSASPLVRGVRTLGNTLRSATKHFEASTYYTILAIVAAVASIVSLIWTFK
jgi:pimeloyl-ACP methyl ester carboxylesterase